MSNVSYKFMEKFVQQPKEMQLIILEQNLKQLQDEPNQDVSDLIDLCKQNIRAVRAQIKKEHDAQP